MAKLKTYKWSWNEYVSPDEFLQRLLNLIEEPVSNLFEMEGDMYMSDMRNLSSARWKLSSVVNETNKGT